MRVLHTSDWHLGQKFINNDRDDEHRQALDWLLEIIRLEKVELLVVAGDIFDTFNPTNNAQQLYYDFLINLRQTGCRHCVVIGGNHDSPSMLSAPRQLLKSLDVHVVGATDPEDISDEIIELKTPSGEIEAVVAAVPFLRDRDLVYATTGESGLERIERIKKGIFDHYQKIGEEVKKYKKLKVPVIATGHLFAYGAETAEKQDNIYIGDKSNIKAGDFPKTLDYVALGHIHRPQLIGGKTHVRYSGSIIPLSFSETKDEKLVWMIDFEKNKIQEITAVPFPVFRRLKTLTGELDDVLKRLKDFAEKHKEELIPWVEIMIESEEIPPDIDTQIREFARDIRVSILKIRINRKRLGKQLTHETVNLEDLDVLDVFRKKCERMGVPKEEMKELEASFRELREGVEQGD